MAFADSSGASDETWRICVQKEVISHSIGLVETFHASIVSRRMLHSYEPFDSIDAVELGDAFTQHNYSSSRSSMISCK